jgi:hypothetical protein
MQLYEVFVCGRALIAGTTWKYVRRERMEQCRSCVIAETFSLQKFFWRLLVHELCSCYQSLREESAVRTQLVWVKVKLESRFLISTSRDPERARVPHNERFKEGDAADRTNLMFTARKIHLRTRVVLLAKVNTRQF